MAILALLLCADPALLQQRWIWLEQQLKRHPKTILKAQPFEGGVLLCASTHSHNLVDMLKIGADFVGRIGWSKRRLDARAEPAAQYFESLQKHMVAMSAAWWWNPQARKLTIVADPVGARPLFYSQDKCSILLTSALWLFEACPWINLSLDEVALHQRVALGYCLEGATPYRAVRRVQGGSRVELVQGELGDAICHRCYRWDAIATDRQPLELQLDEIHHCFTRAIAEQDDGVSKPIAALSGGLDTRVVIAGLLAAQRHPKCLSFTWRKSLDGTIAQKFAEHAGLEQRIVDVPRPLDEPFLIKSGKALMGAGFCGAEQSPVRLWTGYGGSVGAGYVHSNVGPIALARAGDSHGAVRALLKGKGAALSGFLFGRTRARILTAHLESQIIAALERNSPDDLGRRLQLYLLENQEPEQLRPLTENADLLGFDVAAPFYDPRLLAKWLALPLESAIYHRAYVQWMQRLPAAVMAVPWQAYPGHIRSPLPLPVEVDQWSDVDETYLRQLSANDMAFFGKVHSFGGGGSVLVPGWRRFAARAAVGLGLQRYSYLCRISATYAAFEIGKGATMLDGHS
jgi:asparagine synthase (glutamine-hydrolysing)